MADMIDRDAAIALFAADENLPTQIIRDKLNAIPAAQVTVKPLEWEPFGTECVRSYSMAGLYEVIWGFRSGQVCLDMRGATIWFESTEAAKAAAQADYDARIRPALTVTPHDPAKVQALVEALEYALRVAEHLCSDRLHPVEDAHIMVLSDAKIASLSDARAALAAMKEG